MGTVILISSVAVIVAIVGCVVIWRFDVQRAEEIVHERAATPRPSLGGGDSHRPHAVRAAADEVQGDPQS